MPIDPGTESAVQGQGLTVGTRLRQARRDQDLSEKDVADRLHITMHYVKALETDRYEKLPGAIFVKGYLKSYAELLGLDSAALLADYEAAQANQKATQDQHALQEVRRSRDRNRPFAIASLVLFVGVFVGLWAMSQWGDDAPAGAEQVPAAAGGSQQDGTRQAAVRDTATLQPATISPARPLPAAVDGTTDDGDSRPTDTAGTTVMRIERPVASVEQPVNPVAAENDDETPAIAGQDGGQQGVAVTAAGSAEDARLIEVGDSGEDVLRISFAGQSWVEVNDGSEQQLYRDLRHAGDVLEIKGKGPFNILLGDAPLTRLEFNGDEVDVSDDIRIDNSARLTVGL